MPTAHPRHRWIWAGLCAATSAPLASGLDILAYATPVCAFSHQLAIRRAAEALAQAGHNVVLLEPEAAKSRLGDAQGIVRAGGGNGALTIWPLNVMADEVYAERFKAGESFQRLSQEINEQLLEEFLPKASGYKFDLAVVDALYPILARELRLPSVHIVCASDPDAMSGAWFQYGLAGENGQRNVQKNMKFLGFWGISWLMVGTHQSARASQSTLSWGEYYQHYVAMVLLQGTPYFSLPYEAGALIRANPTRMAFVGSLTARPQGEPPAELAAALSGGGGGEASGGLALVAFGSKPNPCPEELLDALKEVGLRAVVLVPACSENEQVRGDHFLPKSHDQAAWLRAGPALKLAVVHGGIHSLHESVGSGVPIACVPHEGDQWINCKDLQQQGLGWAVHPKASAAEAAAAFKMLLENRPVEHNRTARSARAAEALSQAGGVEAVVHAVEQLADSLPTPGEGRPPILPGPPLKPFLVEPFEWTEAWLFSLPIALVTVSCFCRGLQVFTSSTEDYKPRKRSSSKDKAD